MTRPTKRLGSLRPKKHISRGFTLIELMVAMILVLLIIAAVGALFLSSKQTFKVQDNASGIDETMRAIEEDMSREIRKAGYYGCFKWNPSLSVADSYSLTAKFPSDVKGKHPLPMDGTTTVRLGLNYDVSGGSATTPASSVSPLPSDVTLLSGSDFVGITYGQPVAYLVNAVTGRNDPYVINKAVQTQNGQAFIMSNCERLTLFRADQKGAYSSISHDSALGDNIAPDADTPDKWNRFTAGATLLEFKTSVFFLGQKSGEPSTLYIQTPQDSDNPAQPLAANVEQLNILYGVDQGTSTALTYQTASALNETAKTNKDAGKIVTPSWESVKTVRIGLVIASAEQSVSGAAAGAGVKYTWNATSGRYDASSSGADTRLRKQHVFTVAIRGRSAIT